MNLIEEAWKRTKIGSKTDDNLYVYKYFGGVYAGLAGLETVCFYADNIVVSVLRLVLEIFVFRGIQYAIMYPIDKKIVVNDFLGEKSDRFIERQRDNESTHILKHCFARWKNILIGDILVGWIVFPFGFLIGTFVLLELFDNYQVYIYIFSVIVLLVFSAFFEMVDAGIALCNPKTSLIEIFTDSFKVCKKKFFSIFPSTLTRVIIICVFFVIPAVRELNDEIDQNVAEEQTVSASSSKRHDSFSFDEILNKMPEQKWKPDKMGKIVFFTLLTYVIIARFYTWLLAIPALAYYNYKKDVCEALSSGR